MKRHSLCFLVSGLAVFFGAGCGGERCVDDTCGSGPEVDAVVAVPDAVVTSDAGDIAGADSVAGDVRDGDNEPPVDVDAPIECHPQTPYAVGGKCVQCRDCNDCPDIRPACHPAGHFCDPGYCQEGSHFCKHDCQCHECCDGSECPGLDGAAGVCGADGSCVGTVACDEDCGGNLPVCARFDGANHCVECGLDSDCDRITPGRGCKCAPAPLLACVDDDGMHCGSAVDACTSECDDCTGCPQVPNLRLECGDRTWPGSGRSCYDSQGSCDGINGCCAAGMNCHDLTGLFVSGVMGRIPGVPFDLGNVNGGRFCECATDTDCRSGLPCSDTAALCGIPVSDYPVIGLICPDGQLSPQMPARLCAQPESLSDWAMSLSADCADDPHDYPELICTVWGGIEQRVRCLTDDHCLTSGSDCMCILGSCYDSDGANCDWICGGCAATCGDDADCPPTSEGNAQSCGFSPGAGGGYCADPAGTCDDSTSCCAPGQMCYDMRDILQDLVWPDLCWPLLLVPVNRTYCGCETTDDCLNGKECTDVSPVCEVSGDVSGLIEVLCPGGTLAPGVPAKICGTLGEFLAGHVNAP